MPVDDDILFSRVHLALADNPGIKLYELTRRLGINRHSIERAVRAHTGTTFLAFKKQMQFHYAIDHLSKNLYLKEIGALLNYRSPDSLSRFIKRSSGYDGRIVRRITLTKNLGDV